MTQDNKGRGVFASGPITKGDLVIVEKPIAVISDMIDIEDDKELRKAEEALFNSGKK